MEITLNRGNKSPPQQAENRFKCTQCEFTTKKLKRLQSHAKNVHTKESCDENRNRDANSLKAKNLGDSVHTTDISDSVTNPILESASTKSENHSVDEVVSNDSAVASCRKRTSETSLDSHLCSEIFEVSQDFQAPMLSHMFNTPHSHSRGKNGCNDSETLARHISSSHEAENYHSYGKEVRHDKVIEIRARGSGTSGKRSRNVSEDATYLEGTDDGNEKLLAQRNKKVSSKNSKSKTTFTKKVVKAAVHRHTALFTRDSNRNEQETDHSTDVLMTNSNRGQEQQLLTVTDPELQVNCHPKSEGNTPSEGTLTEKTDTAIQQSPTPANTDYVCNYCRKTFMRKSSLTRHMKCHTGSVDKTPILRPSSSFMYSQNHTECSRTNSVDKNESSRADFFTCSFCGFIAMGETEIIQHKNAFHPKERYLCTFCEFSTRKWRKWIKHKKNKHLHYQEVNGATLGKNMEDNFPEKPCPETNAVIDVPGKFCAEEISKEQLIDENFRNRGARLEGRTRKDSELQFQLDSPNVCDKSEGQDDDTICPVIVPCVANPKDQRHSCSYCSKTFSSKQSLNRHLKIHLHEGKMRNKEKGNVCPHCGKFFSKRYLTTHIRIHTGERPFKCCYCEFSAAQSGDLTAHIRTHTGERPFTCKFCDYAAAECGTLKRHVRVHLNEKPYKCDVCDYASVSSNNLRRHYRKHTGEKPYACNICGKWFADQPTFSRHSKRKHQL